MINGGDDENTLEGLTQALMTDDLSTVEEYSKKMNPLHFMLKNFRAISRPYSHNKQIVEAKKTKTQIMPFIKSDPELTTQLLHGQVMALVHRLDHYFYVNAYIKAYPTKTAQLKSVATGGSNTTGFLPDLIKSNILMARSLLRDLNSASNSLSNEAKKKECDDQMKNFDKILSNFEDKTNQLLGKMRKVEEEENKRKINM
jgi:hypothetical protein